jgi:hypothetical protein
VTANDRGAGTPSPTATIAEIGTDQSSDLAAQSTQLSEVDAVAITSAIRTGLVAVWDKVAAAYHGRAWVPLGYDSWDDYCHSEFDGSRIRIPREQREDIVTSLRDEGLSLRSIASATGQSHETVRKDAMAGVKKLTPAMATSPASDPPRPVSQFGEMVAEIAATTTTDEPVHPMPRVVGRDGKSYAATANVVVNVEVVNPPAPRRRRPLPDACNNAVWELRRAVERLERLRTDDRYPALRRSAPSLERQVAELRVRLLPATVEDQPVLAMPQQVRRGPRAKHVDVLSRIANNMQGCDIALTEITVLDDSVTRDEAARIRDDLLQSQASFDRIIGLLDTVAAASAAVVAGGVQ